MNPVYLLIFYNTINNNFFITNTSLKNSKNISSNYYGKNN